MMLLYHGKGIGSNFNDDAASQLLEYSIRDPSVPSGGAKFQDELDYDVSFVNTMFLPVAMEAAKTVNGKQSIGYAGTTDTLQNFETAMQAFTNGSILHNYFTDAPQGMGWPQYYLSDPSKPINPSDLIKVPAGYNVFAESVGVSSYSPDNSRGLLTSSQAYLAIPSTNNNYAVQDLTNLWFSWLKFDLDHTQDKPNDKLTTLMNEPNVHTFDIKTDPTHMWTLADGSTVSDTKFAEAYAKTVFNVMTTFTRDPNVQPPPTKGEALYTTKLIAEIVGNNVGLFLKDTDPLFAITTQEVISLMRGEPNTEAKIPGYPPSPSYALPESAWYPAPADPTKGNDSASGGLVGKYNLNPIVWFVHKYYLPGKYVYTFANDDDFGNIRVLESNHLIITVGGSTGLLPDNGQIPYVPSQNR
jgi:hypothetical protein